MHRLTPGRYVSPTLLAAGVLPAGTVGVLAVLSTIRPNLGWPLLMVTVFVTGAVFTFTGNDLRAEQRAQDARWGNLEADKGTERGGRLMERMGAVSLYCLSTAVLGVVYIGANAAWGSL